MTSPDDAAARPSAGPETGPEDPRVARAVEEYLAEERAGHRPARDRFLARHAEIAAELSECLNGLAFIQGAAPRLRRAALGEPPDPAVTPAGPLGDFRLVRELGRGGMGVVYEAEQLSLARRVALKVLPFAAALDPKQLRRFQNEALAAAHLNHPHIVPVYGVGCERGVHYYAMQLIEGQTLAALIGALRNASGLGAEPPSAAAGADPAPGPETQPLRVAGLSTERSHRSPSFIRAAAGLGAQAAEALEYAHQMGVVHRDVKPANLMVDGRGHLWVTDFGLAQFRGGPDLTLTGDLVGTLRYMAPEQASAKHDLVDDRADVYALGVTLYELLTLRPAVGGADRQEVLRRLLDGDFPAPRRLNPAVPADLETVLLKATAREPAARYATARELADDLRRFLDDRPINARRPGLAWRAARWVQKRLPLVAAGAAALALTAAVLAAALAYVSAERASAARQRDFARRAVDDMYTDVAEQWLGQEPGLEEAQRESLLKALRYYQEFARDAGRGPDVRFAAAQASRRVGDLQQRLEEFADAERAYRDTIPRLRRLAEEHPARREFREELAGCRHALGELLAQAKRPAEAEAEYREAVTLREQLLGGPADPARARRDLGVSVGGLGRALHLTGRPAEAAEAYERAVGLLGGSPDPSPKGAAYEGQLAATLGHLAELRGGQGRLGQARGLLERSIESQRVASKARARHPAHRRALAGALARLGAVQLRLGDPALAEGSYREALAVLDRLADDFPGTAAYRAELARTHAHLADLYHLAGRRPEAVESYRRAAGQWGRLAREFPASPWHAQALAWLLATCPEPEVRDPGQAVAHARRAVALAPEGADCRRALGASLLRAGDLPGAVAELGQAVALRSGGDGREWLLLSLAHARLGDRGKARAFHDRSAEWLRGRAEDATLRGLHAESEAGLRQPPTPRD